MKLQIKRVKAVYHSPNGRHTAFLIFFEELLDSILYKHPFLIVRDFNINWDSSFCEKDRTKANDNQVVQLVENPTHITQTSTSIINLVMTNSNAQYLIFNKPVKTDHVVEATTAMLKDDDTYKTIEIRTRDKTDLTIE